MRRTPALHPGVHVTSWPGVTVRQPGGVLAHPASATGQRVANRQPATAAKASGPGIVSGNGRNISRGPVSRGFAASRARVYGCAAVANSVRAGPRSTGSPAYSTSASSHTVRASRRSCVMNSTAVPCAACIRRSRAMTVACVVTSSAVVGSSAISSAGLDAKASAISTRWHSPPDSWCGYRRNTPAGSRSPTSASAATAC